MSSNTTQERYKLESSYGTRFFVLAFLPYFDTIRMTVIDSIHNLFLGSVKNLLKIWKELGYLNKANLEKIQEKKDSFIITHEVGKIPKKIICGFDGFNADEYKTVLLLFSIYSLYGIIPSRDLNCIRKCLLACTCLCKKIISKSDITVAHELLIQFCKKLELIHGKERVTPNMHLYLHIKECILDYGPVYGFWLFSFQIYNDMLGSLPNNKKNIEPQIIGLFCSESLILNISEPKMYRENFSFILSDIEKLLIQRGTLHQIELKDMLKIASVSSR